LSALCCIFISPVGLVPLTEVQITKAPKPFVVEEVLSFALPCAPVVVKADAVNTKPFHKPSSLCKSNEVATASPTILHN